MATTPKSRVAALEAEIVQLRARLAALEGTPGHGEAFLAAVLAAVPAFILRADAELKIRFVNRFLAEDTPADVIGVDLFSFVHPESQGVAREAIGRVLETGASEQFDAVGRGPDRSEAIYQTFVAPIDEPDGRRAICLVAFDVTAERLRERRLVESQENLRVAVEASGVALWSWNMRTGEVVWDDGMRRMLGRDEPLDLPRYLDEAVHPDDRAWFREVSSGSLELEEWQAPPHRIVRPDGEVRWLTSSGRVERDATGRPLRVVGGNLDVTALRAAEEQARQAQRLDAVGRLTAGVAHNFNNMLTVITSSLDLLRRRSTGADIGLVDDARDAARQGAEMVRQLMTFAGQRPQPERGARRIDDVVRRAVAICRRTFEGHIALDHRIAERLPAVVCSESEVEQIAMNLLLNARDAVLEAGRSHVRISVELEPAEEHGKPGVHLRVRDDGIGMSAEVASRIFEPFFTTKPLGRGTGLGLATSYATARELGGTLGVSSEPGRGATFTLWLPASEQAGVAETPGEGPRPPRGTRVLLVDDERPIRQALAALLRDGGLDAEAVASGDEALERLRRGPPVDVVLLDRAMPGAPGEFYLPAIRTLAPAAKVALFTGQPVEPELASRFDAVIAKPIAAGPLFAALQDLLAR